MIARRMLTVRWLMMGALLAGGASCATGNGVDPEFLDEDAGEPKPEEDAGEPEDTGVPEDTGELVDTGAVDGGARDVLTADAGVDAGSRDAGPRDTGPVDSETRDTGPVDTGPRDAGPLDTGTRDTGPVDAGPRDTGPLDTGLVDTGPRDTGPVDTGPRDTGPVDTGPPDAPTCVPMTEVSNRRDDDCDGLVDEGFSGNVPALSLSCTGNGLVAVVSGSNIDDGGDTSSDDSLLVYCVRGLARFCLSGELCPWRAGPPAVDDGRSCSSSGLRSTVRYGRPYFMAFITRRDTYLIIDRTPVDLFYCPPDGRVIFGSTY